MELKTESKAVVLPASQETLQLASQRLRNGELVSFPTETVYGLGANALSAEACLKIFTSKGRPLTDPLITHVSSIEQGLDLIDKSDESIVDIFKLLGNKYWPGPLTLVTKANLDKIPMMITAQTGFVGIRIPQHEVARSLIEMAQVPVAAPSANKFGHVSPTKAEHVYKDFAADTDVVIIDGGSCNFGIESTVLKLEKTAAGFKLTIIRKGGVSLANLQQTISDEGLGGTVTLEQLCRDHHLPEVQNLEAPGQFLRHYSPDIVSYLFTGRLTQQKLNLEKAILIDFGKTHADFKDKVMLYTDLSENRNVVEAINKVYDTLRWAETNTDAESVLITDIYYSLDHVMSPKPITNEEHLAALCDRLFRAASGQQA